MPGGPFSIRAAWGPKNAPKCPKIPFGVEMRGSPVLASVAAGNRSLDGLGSMKLIIN